MATYLMLSRHCRGVVTNQAGTSAAVRPSIWPSSPPLPEKPLVGGGILLPARPTAPGLVDAQHLRLGQRRVGDLAGLDAEGVHHDWPGQVQVTGGLEDRGPGIPHPAPGRTSQPGGQPGAGRYLRDLLGERPTSTARLPAEPAPLVPAELQPALAIGKVTGPGDRGTLHSGGEDSAGRAGPGRLIRRDQMHPTGAVRQPLDPRDGHPVEVEQQRRIVEQARGSCMIVLRREQR
jgi:hypothetical protein